RKMDKERFVQRFTPRKPESRWSPINIERARKLIRQRRMTAAGLAVFHPERTIEPWATKFPRKLETRFRKRSTAWENFQRFPPYYRRMTIAGVASAKKEDTRVRRLTKLVEYSRAGRRIK